MLMATASAGKGMHPVMKTMGETLARGHRVQAISRLLELRLLVASSSEISSEEYAALTEEVQAVDFLRSHTTYQLTPFGDAVMVLIARRWRLDRFMANRKGSK
jgi:hypothetical protein